MYLFIDTETTGLPTSNDAPYTHLNAWPRMVSVCWARFSGPSSKTLFRYYIIRPDGFTIPREATLIHGITTEHARKEGIPLATALSQLAEEIAARPPRLLIAHNMQFDRPVLLAEYLRATLDHPIGPLRTHCTMVTTTELCRLPPFRNGQHKWPKLKELHYHLFGFEPSASHHAGADVLHCAKCFFRLQAMGLAPVANGHKRRSPIRFPNPSLAQIASDFALHQA